LRISDNGIKDEGLMALAGSPIFKNLIYLDVSYNDLKVAGA
jgi:hypothetical protein